MLAEIVAGMLVIGLAIWVIGEVFSYTGVAAIGATVIIITGSAVALTGIDVRTGSTKTFSYTQVNNETVRNASTVNFEYQTTSLARILNIGVLGSLGMGGLIMFLGAILFSKSLSEDIQ